MNLRACLCSTKIFNAISSPIFSALLELRVIILSTATMSLSPSPQIHLFTGISSNTIFLGMHYYDEPAWIIHEPTQPTPRLLHL